jgi:hypothetical protein
VGREMFFKCDFFFNYMKGTAPFLIFVQLWSWIFDNGGNENQILKQAAIVELLAPGKTLIDVDVNAVINSNRKQGHQLHTPHYEKQIEFFL